MNRSRIKKIFISSLIIGVALTGVYFIARMPAAEVAELSPEEVIINVEVEPVEPERSVPDFLDLPGTVVPGKIVNVPVELGGKIISLPVREGELIKKGDIILKLDQSILEAEAARARAQAEFDKKSLDRTAMLLEKGVANPNSLDEIRSRYAVSSAVLEIAETNLDKTTVHAPYGGILNQVLVEEGEYVQEGSTVAEIVEVDKLKVQFQVPEKEAKFLHQGSTMDIIEGKSSNWLCNGPLTYISAVADPGTKTIEAEITLDNRERVIRSGQIVRVRLNRKSLNNAIMVPLAAVIPLEQGKVVYVASNGVAERREVTLGVIKGTRVQITKGLSKGDQLIVKGHRRVGPGQKINIVS